MSITRCGRVVVGREINVVGARLHDGAERREGSRHRGAATVPFARNRHTRLRGRRGHGELEHVLGAFVAFAQRHRALCALLVGTAVEHFCHLQLGHRLIQLVCGAKSLIITTIRAKKNFVFPNDFAVQDNIL